MKKFLVLAGMLAATPAYAGDGYVNTDRFDWTGIYLGVQGGYADGKHEGNPTYTDANPKYSYTHTESTIDLGGGIGGLTLGAQRQFGSLVLGVEGDVSWGNIEGEDRFVLPYDYHWNLSTEIDTFATLRGRVGWSFGQLMIYGTGGAAWADVSSKEHVTSIDGWKERTTTVLASSSEDKWGWTAGAGAEWQFHHGWSLKAEWVHVDLGNVDTNFSGTAYPGIKGMEMNYAQDSFPGDIKFDVVRAGLNYRF
jgi:outer membrane immunogenic protein